MALHFCMTFLALLNDLPSYVLRNTVIVFRLGTLMMVKARARLFVA